MGLLRTDVSRVEIERVLLSEESVGLAPLTIIANEYPVEVALRAQMPAGVNVTFQTRNENLNQSDDDPDDWNALFNEVDCVQSIRLDPGESRRLIVAFRSVGGSTLGEDAAVVDLRASSKAHRSHSIGVLRGFLHLEPRVATDVVDGSGSGVGVALVREPAQQLVLELIGRVCRSVLKADVQELVFETCVVGSSSVKDFTVWNCSEVPLAFSVETATRRRGGVRAASATAAGGGERAAGGGGERVVAAAELECSSLDGSSMMLGESGETIPGFSHARIRLHFKPREIGQYTMEVVLRNLNDARNRETVGVHALVTSQPQHAGLLVGGNGLLDFGDCYASAATRQLLVVRNISDEALDVHFSSDLPDEVSFDLLGEEEGGSATAGRERRGQEIGASADEVESFKRGGADGDGDDAASAVEVQHARGAEGSRMRRIEELPIAPGRERAVHVSYTPQRLQTGADGAPATRLTRRVFRVDLKAFAISRQRADASAAAAHFSRSVQCRARVCTSVVAISPPRLDMGDCNIQTHKSATALVRNLCDLPSEISISMHSKVISTKLTSLTIAPRSSHELKFHFVPRRVNPEYRKQVTISNLTNPGEQHFLEFIANNVDRHNISFHSLFYKLALLPAPSVAASALVPVAPAVARRTTSARATADALSASTDVRRPLEELRSMPPDACRVAFNDVVARCSHVRAFSIRNISAQPLVLRLACASGHGSLAIYRQSRGLRDSAAETTDSSSHRGAQPSRTAPSTLVRTELSAVAGSGTAVEGIQDGAADSAHAATSKGSRREQLLQRFEERQQQHVPHHKGSVELEDVISPSGPRSGSAQARRRALVSVDEAAPAARGEAVARGRALDVALMRAETSNATPELRGSAVRWPALGLPERRPEASPGDHALRRHARYPSHGGADTTSQASQGTSPTATTATSPTRRRVAAEAELTATNMVALARCFRDLPLCTPQAVAAAAALEELRAAGTMEDAAALGAVLAAWSGAAEGESAAAPTEIEAALVKTHAFLRSVFDGWKRSGHLVRLAASSRDGGSTSLSEELRLMPDEVHVLLVEFVPALPADSEATDVAAAAAPTTALAAACASAFATGAGGACVDTPPTAPVRRRVLAGVRRHRKAKVEGAISLQLVEYDHTLRRSHEERLLRFSQYASGTDPTDSPAGLFRVSPPSPPRPPQPQLTRDLPVIGTACASCMEIGQRSINFGTCEWRQPLEKCIVIHNRSEAQLYYRVVKTGQYASFDVQISKRDRAGCVRPFGVREISFLFKPSLTGPFEETLTVHNVQDERDTQHVLVKAHVVKAAAFHLKAPELDFGPSVANRPQQSPPKRIVLVNLARGAKRFVLRCSGELTRLDGTPGPCSAVLTFVLERTTTGGGDALVESERRREDTLEVLERKLRIAVRKGKLEKSERLRRKIRALRDGDEPVTPSASDIESDASASDWGGNSESESESETAYTLQRTPRRGGGIGWHGPTGTNEISFRLGPNCTQTIALSFRAVHNSGLIGGTAAGKDAFSAVPSPSCEAAVAGVITVCESRDRASAQDVPFYALVCTNREFHTRSPFTEDTLRLLPAPALFARRDKETSLALSSDGSPAKGHRHGRDAHDATPTTLSASTSSPASPERTLSPKACSSPRSSGVSSPVRGRSGERLTLAAASTDATDVTAPSTLSSPPSTPVPMAPNLMVSTTDTLDGTSAEPASPASPLPVRPAKCHADDGANPEANTPPPTPSHPPRYPRAPQPGPAAIPPPDTCRYRVEAEFVGGEAAAAEGLAPPVEGGLAAAETRLLGTLEFGRETTRKLTLISLSDNETVALRLFWSGVPSFGAGGAHGAHPRLGAEEGHRVLLSTPDVASAVAADGLAAASNELVPVLHVKLPPRQPVVVLVQALAHIRDFSRPTLSHHTVHLLLRRCWRRRSRRAARPLRVARSPSVTSRSRPLKRAP
jgi:hypothetical protein